MRDAARFRRALLGVALPVCLMVVAGGVVVPLAIDGPGWVRVLMPVGGALAVFCCWHSWRQIRGLLIDRDESQVEAREHGRALRAVLDSIVDPILSIDERGTITSANPATERVFGWRQGDVMGRNVAFLMGEPYRSQHDGYLAAYLGGGEARAIGRVRKVLGRRRDGEEFACELSVSEVVREGRRQFWGVIRDISDREQFAVRMAAAERLAAVGELAAGVAHEVNNPVNTIINCAQLIKQGDTSPELCDHVLHEGVRIAGFVRDLMTVASDRRDGPVDSDPLRAVRRALGLMQVRFRHGRIALVELLPDELPRVGCAEHRVQQIVLNLLLNARDAVMHLGEDAAAPRIEVTAEVIDRDGRPPCVRVSVADNGPGIESNLVERVFQPFYTTKAAGEGTGLGLAVSRSIARESGGELVATSTPFQRTEFSLTLPLAAAVTMS